MKKTLMFFGSGLLILVLLVSVAAAQQAESMPDSTEKEEVEAEISGLQVEMIACGTDIEERELLGEATSFSKDIGQIYCWTQITGGEEPTTVDHIWHFAGVEKARVVLNVKYPRVRTWSSKTILPEWVGDWHVEAVDASGKVLATIDFTVE
ncbi:MAG: DUF2914 domain-containing protein [candidate division Zixibacteria bacterium]|nr:DUF2914 domain-containing protein [candidate division Zixibacteria bacterium]